MKVVGLFCFLVSLGSVAVAATDLSWGKGQKPSLLGVSLYPEISRRFVGQNPSGEYIALRLVARMGLSQVSGDALVAPTKVPLATKKTEPATEVVWEVPIEAFQILSKTLEDYANQEWIFTCVPGPRNTCMVKELRAIKN